MDEEIQKDVNDCGPQVIEQYVGQRQVVRRCKIALEASWNEGTRLPHMLMLGSPGLGKTELCHLLAREMGCELHEQLAQNIRLPKDLHAFLLSPKDKDVVLLDEIHELPPVTQTTLYRALENQQIFLSTKQGKKSRPISIANFTVLGATTNPERLLQPLRDRFKVVLDLTFYSSSELEQLLRNRIRRLAWNVEDSVLSLIAQRGKGTPRIALRLLESVRMTACAQNAEVITPEHFHTTCQLEGIDPLGLTSQEVRYLQILYENDGAVRLNIIASRLGVHQKHVSSILEQFLIREGLVTKNNSVRVLTQYGLEHFREHHLNGEAS
jgi:Holliday junction DNA helicase RuvB